MSWENILKDKKWHKDEPRPPSGKNQKETTEFEEVSDSVIEILQKPEEQEGPSEKFKLWITGQRGTSRMAGNWYEIAGKPEGQTYNSRREVHNALKEEMKIGNPKPWTVEGNLYGGEMVIYDGIFRVMGVPEYYYIIIEENEELPDASDYHPRTDWTSREALMDRMAGYESDPEEQTFGTRDYLGERGHEDLVE